MPWLQVNRHRGILFVLFKFTKGLLKSFFCPKISLICFYCQGNKKHFSLPSNKTLNLCETEHTLIKITWLWFFHRVITIIMQVYLKSRRGIFLGCFHAIGMLNSLNIKHLTSNPIFFCFQVKDLKTNWMVDLTHFLFVFVFFFFFCSSLIILCPLIICRWQDLSRI